MCKPIKNILAVSLIDLTYFRLSDFIWSPAVNGTFWYV